MLSYKTVKIGSNQMKTLLKYTQCYKEWQIVTILKINLVMLAALICSFHIRLKKPSRLFPCAIHYLNIKKKTHYDWQ